MRTATGSGRNYEMLPVNKPQGPVHTYNRDGAMRFDGKAARSRTMSRTASAARCRTPAFRRAATEDFRRAGMPTAINHRDGNDDYTQPGNLFRLMTAEAKARLIENIVGSMKSVPQRIQEKQIQHFLKADPAYGAGVAKGLGIEVNVAVGV